MAEILYRPTVSTDCVVDISHYQQHVDFARLKAGGIILAFIKATQGDGGADQLWYDNANAADDADMMYAPYHFVTAAPVDAQFAHFMQIAEPEVGDVVMLDWEHNPSGPTANPDQVAALGTKIEQALQRAPLIYCGRYQLHNPHPVLSKWSLILPEYGDRPICPPGWSRWLFHQYTDLGTVDGIKGHVDRSVFAGTHDQLRAWWESGTLPDAPASAQGV